MSTRKIRKAQSSRIHSSLLSKCSGIIFILYNNFRVEHVFLLLHVNYFFHAQLLRDSAISRITNADDATVVRIGDFVCQTTAAYVASA